MAIFKKDEKAPKPSSASPPEEPETAGEIKHIEELSKDSKPKNPSAQKEDSNMEYREIPVCMSQTQINNLVIENNIILKQIISQMN